MIIIAHRKNTIKELQETDTKYGIEMDLRNHDDKLLIHHDAFTRGEDFEEWIKHFKHNTLILNVKEEGLENRLLEIMKQYNIENFFFLDQSFPFLIKTAKTGEKRCAVRLSEYETIHSVLNLAGMVDWVWVDCFTKFPIGKEDIVLLKEKGFKLCLVSPDLQGRFDEQEIESIKNIFKEIGLKPDAVCTKTSMIPHWENF